MNNYEENNVARESILRSIREHLTISVAHDMVRRESGKEPPTVGMQAVAAGSLIEVFRKNVEDVGGHCIVVRGEVELANALAEIISRLQAKPLFARRIALSNAPTLERLIGNSDINVDEVTAAPGVAELFTYDVGISTVQAAIAETGTLVLDSEAERHRLVSLVPPVHIAIVDAADICFTLGEALAIAQQRSPVSSTITLITGPSRTADIELTLAIGVHGPQELFVVVNEIDPPPAEEAVSKPVGASLSGRPHRRITSLIRNGAPAEGRPYRV